MSNSRPVVRIRRFRAAASAIPSTSTTTTLGGGAAFVPTAVATQRPGEEPDRSPDGWCRAQPGAGRRLGLAGRAAACAGARELAARSAPCAAPRQLVPGLAEHVAEDGHDLIELGRPGDQRRRDLDDGVAAVVGPADQTALEQARRQEPAQERLGLVVRERLARLLVLDELERVEEAGAAQVADDREVEQLRERRAELLLVLAHVLDDPLPPHDLDVLERDRALDGMARRR